MPIGQWNGRTAVFLHGMNFFGLYWGDTMEALRQEGFRLADAGQGRGSL
ncbi:MAG: hypothetical protein WD766_14045 [Gemmatimonadota bacterium]